MTRARRTYADKRDQMADRVVAPPTPSDVPDGFLPAFLMITSGGVFNAHWALFVPSQADPSCGKRVHATGDKRNGFVAEALHDFDLGELQGTRKFVFLSWIHQEYLFLPHSRRGERTDSAQDKLENVAFQVSAPGPSIVCLAFLFSISAPLTILLTGTRSA
jgi:hypothetical protein